MDNYSYNRSIITPHPSTPRGNLTNAPRKPSSSSRHGDMYGYGREETGRVGNSRMSSYSNGGGLPPTPRSHGRGGDYGEYYSNDQQQHERYPPTPRSQGQHPPTPTSQGRRTPMSPRYESNVFAAPGRSIVSNNGIQHHREIMQAKRKWTSAEARKTQAFLGPGIEPDLQLSYSPRVVQNLVDRNRLRFDKLGQREQREGPRPRVFNQMEVYSRGSRRARSDGMRQALSFCEPTSTILPNGGSPRNYRDRVVGRFNAKPNLGELNVKRPMARENYTREKAPISWSREDFSQDTTHLVSPRTFTSPYRSAGERIVAARNVLADAGDTRRKSTPQSPRASSSSDGRNTKPLYTRTYNARFVDESKPPYNVYHYKPPAHPDPEYPRANAKPAESGPLKGRVRKIAKPTYEKGDLNESRAPLPAEQRQANPQRVFTYKNKVTLKGTQRGPKSSY